MLEGESENKPKTKSDDESDDEHIVTPIGCLFLLLVLLSLSCTSFALVYHLCTEMYTILVGHTRLLVLTCTAYIACTDMYWHVLTCTQVYLTLTCSLFMLCACFVQTCSLWHHACIMLMMLCLCCVMLWLVASCWCMWHHADDVLHSDWLHPADACSLFRCAFSFRHAFFVLC